MTMNVGDITPGKNIVKNIFVEEDSDLL